MSDNPQGGSPVNRREDARITPIDAGMMRRATDKLNRLLSGFWRGGGSAEPQGAAGSLPPLPPLENAGPRVPPQIAAGHMANQGEDSGNPMIPSLTAAGHEPYMQPAQPMAPIPPRPGDVAGRRIDYPFGYNLNVQPRRFEPISFTELEGIAESLDLVRLCVETRKDQLANLTWSCAKRKRPNEEQRQAPDERCAMIEDFLRCPDRRTPWTSWVREVVDAQLVTDAPAVYVRRTLGGDVYSLEVLDGTKIVPKLDQTGRTPMPPDVAYQQIVQGVPGINYTTDDLIYWPRNRRPGKVYGCSPVQQIITTVNIALRREVAKINYFTEGNVPDALMSVPKEWSVDQIARFQSYWDALLADQRERRKMKFVPGDMNYMPTRNDQMLGDATDEWLARVICFAFSLPPLPFVKMMNRNTAESAYEAALEEGLAPMIVWLKSMLDHIVQKVFGFADLEVVPDDIRKIDPAEQQQRNMTLIQLGVKSIDEVRIEMGLEPIGMSHAIWGIGPMGVMFVDDLLKAKKMGLGIPQQAPPPDAMGGMPGVGGLPAPGDAGASLPPATSTQMHPEAARAIAGVNPRVLDAVGLGAGGSEARTVDVTDAEARASDPLGGVVVHPQVLQTLREAQRMHRRLGVG